MPYYGFNFQWMFAAKPDVPAQPPDEAALDFMADMGLDFVRIPVDYHFWTRGFDYLHPDERGLAPLDDYLRACRDRGLHMCLNLHRAPGYCINRNHLERDNLWTDSAAEEGFVFQWQSLARRYKGVPGGQLSFNLLNEPPDVGQHGMTRERHEAVMRRAVAAVRAVDPDRPMVLDGLAAGNLVLPELADLGVVHSTRGYQPMYVSHYQAAWWAGSENLPQPAYPGMEWNGTVWDRQALEDHYAPWRALERQGVTVHVGEFGCYNKTPNDVAVRWFEDLFGILRRNRWGYAMWSFRGAFGVVEHGRPGATYEDFHGLKVDRDLLELFLDHRVTA